MRFEKMLATSILLSFPLVADISGVVFRDFNQNGVKDTNEPGVKGVSVKAYNDAKSVVATATTDEQGNYTLNTSSGKYRVEFSEIPNFLKAGTAIEGNTKALVSIVNDGTTKHNIGLINIGEYCQANPDIMVTRMSKYAKDSANKDIGTFLSYKYSANRDDNATQMLKYVDVGTIYGMAHLKRANITFLGSYFKRHGDIGPSGVGAIYKYDHKTKQVSTFATLPGSDPRNAGPEYDWNHDTVAYRGW